VRAANPSRRSKPSPGGEAAPAPDQEEKGHWHRTRRRRSTGTGPGGEGAPAPDQEEKERRLLQDFRVIVVIYSLDNPSEAALHRVRELAKKSYKVRSVHPL
jgi:hypothetical protein